MFLSKTHPSILFLYIFILIASTTHYPCIINTPIAGNTTANSVLFSGNFISPFDSVINSVVNLHDGWFLDSISLTLTFSNSTQFTTPTYGGTSGGSQNFTLEPGEQILFVNVWYPSDNGAWINNLQFVTNFKNSTIFGGHPAGKLEGKKISLPIGSTGNDWIVGLRGSSIMDNALTIPSSLLETLGFQVLTMCSGPPTPYPVPTPEPEYSGGPPTPYPVPTPEPEYSGGPPTPHPVPTPEPVYSAPHSVEGIPNQFKKIECNAFNHTSSSKIFSCVGSEWYVTNATRDLTINGNMETISLTGDLQVDLLQVLNTSFSLSGNLVFKQASFDNTVGHINGSLMALNSSIIINHSFIETTGCVDITDSKIIIVVSTDDEYKNGDHIWVIQSPCIIGNISSVEIQQQTSCNEIQGQAIKEQMELVVLFSTYNKCSTGSSIIAIIVGSVVGGVWIFLTIMCIGVIYKKEKQLQKELNRIRVNMDNES